MAKKEPRTEIPATIRFPTDLHEELTVEAAEQSRSLNGQVIHELRLLRKMLKARKKAAD